MKADLHLHSNHSDGVLSPRLLSEECIRNGVTLMSITDHDTFAGSDELIRGGCSITVIPGVELSLNDMKCLHLLCYGFSRGNPLRERVATLADRRMERASRILDRLNSLGMPLDIAEVSRRVHGTIGRPHIARAMVHAGYVRSMQEAFDRYIGHGRPAYVSSERLSMDQAIMLARSSGFIPVLAHPCELQLPDSELIALLKKWKALGLGGLEVYHPSAASYGYERLDSMARRMGLLVTGGSDFHQDNDNHGRIGSTVPYWHRIDKDTERLLDALDKKRTED